MQSIDHEHYLLYRSPSKNRSNDFDKFKDFQNITDERDRKVLHTRQRSLSPDKGLPYYTGKKKGPKSPKKKNVERKRSPSPSGSQSKLPTLKTRHKIWSNHLSNSQGSQGSTNTVKEKSPYENQKVRKKEN